MRSQRLQCVVLILAVLATVGSAVHAVDSPPTVAATVYSASVQLVASEPFEEAALTVSNGDLKFRQKFARGERPEIGLFDPAGNLLPDGVYRWELDLVPTAEAAEKLRDAARKHGAHNTSAWVPRSGSFAIAGGRFVDPNASEPDAVRVESGLSGSQMKAAFGGREPERGTDAMVAGGACEAEARSATERVPEVSFGSAFLGDRLPGGDSDVESALLPQKVETPISKAAPAHYRTIDPNGANGRPRSDHER